MKGSVLFCNTDLLCLKYSNQEDNHFYLKNTKKWVKKKMDITVNPVYKGHSKEPENVAFRSSYPFYTG